MEVTIERIRKALVPEPGFSLLLPDLPGTNEAWWATPQNLGLARIVWEVTDLVDDELRENFAGRWR